MNPIRFETVGALDAHTETADRVRPRQVSIATWTRYEANIAESVLQFGVEVDTRTRRTSCKGSLAEDAEMQAAFERACVLG